nr:GRIP and coiled-coil domain-containing protein [Tanacetum cinerariifolium]
MSPKESVGSNDMVHNYYLEEAKKKVQIQKEHALNSKPSVQKTARLPNTANGTKPKPRNSYKQPRNWPPSISSHVSNRTVNIAKPPRNSKPFLNSKNLACPTCKKCIYTGNHDACIFQYLSEFVNKMASQRSGMGRLRREDESLITRCVDSVFKFVRFAEFEILFLLFFLIAFLIFKDLTSRPEYNKILVKKPGGPDWWLS